MYGGFVEAHGNLSQLRETSSIHQYQGKYNSLLPPKSRNQVSLTIRRKVIHIYEFAEFYKAKAEQCSPNAYKTGSLDYDYDDHESTVDPTQSRVTTATAELREKQL